MAPTRKKTEGPEVAEGRRKLPERKVSPKKIGKANPTPKRGQPTAAARLVSSSWVKFGWHKPLSGGVKEAVQHISTMADSMYMLQVHWNRPIEPLSLRNGIFWEHRKLSDGNLVSTPALDHIDLFPRSSEAFQETIQKISKKQCTKPGCDPCWTLHYMFDSMRNREFLLLPIHVEQGWVTIIARIAPKHESNNDKETKTYTDREVTDLAIVDPFPENRTDRMTLIMQRLIPILAEGCIELSMQATRVRDFGTSDIAVEGADPYWQTGLIAYAVSCEFLRRLRMLEYRRSQGEGLVISRDFLWQPFEENYQLDMYRQNLMAACAHQTIEKSGYQVRLALEVPSEDCNYEPLHLGGCPSADDRITPEDEKWDVFQKKTHTFMIPRSHSPPESPQSAPQPFSRSPSPPAETPPAGTEPPNDLPAGESGPEQNENAPPSPSPSSTQQDPGADDRAGPRLSPSRIPGLTLVGSPRRASGSASPVKGHAGLLQPPGSPVLVAPTPTGGLSPPMQEPATGGAGEHAAASPGDAPTPEAMASEALDAMMLNARPRTPSPRPALSSNTQQQRTPSSKRALVEDRDDEERSPKRARQ
ncbi:hypothetical protein SAMD00023353_2000590 [Rosellinia necatrix]|uniref:Uncharacterized protein n=1 Tax=Rosellinia necatrix TaxID=77044 RepID=A0A1W2TF42_ROSNE|nr:hypothetical protein SAMD00023353_2000590 [Rosellinia necatrix]